MIVNLCETFRERAFWTWAQLRTAHALQVHLGEESFTDFNLLEIRSRHGREVVTKTFSKPMESLLGADWEWWFTGPSSRWLGFRLQAKTIDHRHNTFEHLHYVTKAGVAQSDLLCDRATKAKPRCIPLYCLYVHWTPAHSRPPWRCVSYSATPESYGCSLVDAFLVRSSRTEPDSRSLDYLMPHLTPWHCLVCCEGYGAGDLPTRALNFYKNQIATSGEAAQFGFEIIQEPPRYVRLLLQNQLSEPPDPFLRTVTVFREAAEAS